MQQLYLQDVARGLQRNAGMVAGLMVDTAPRKKHCNLGWWVQHLDLSNCSCIKEKRRCRKSTNLNCLDGGGEGGGYSACVSPIAVALARRVDVE